MENLVAKWKSTLSGKKLYDSSLTVEKLQSSRNNSNQKPDVGRAKKDLDLADSDEEQERNIKKKLKSTSSDSSSLSSIEVSSAEENKAKKGQKLGKSRSSHKQKEGSLIEIQIEETIYKILDVFDGETKTNRKEKISKLKLILEKFSNNFPYKREENPNNQEKNNMKSSFMNKIENSSKVMTELEKRLFENEKEKINLRKEKEELLVKMELLKKNSNSSRINEEAFEIIRENNKTLEKNNAFLLSELDSQRQKYQEQQRIFEREIKELSQTLRNLKSQISPDKSLF